MNFAVPLLCIRNRPGGNANQSRIRGHPDCNIGGLRCTVYAYSESKRSIIAWDNDKGRRFIFTPGFDDDTLTNNIVERLNGTSRAIKSKFEIAARRTRRGRSAQLASPE